MLFAIAIFLACLIVLDLCWSALTGLLFSRLAPALHDHVERRWWLYRALIWLLALLTAWLLSDTLGYPR